MACLCECIGPSLAPSLWLPQPWEQAEIPVLFCCTVYPIQLELSVPHYSGKFGFGRFSADKQHIAIISKCGLGILEMEPVQSVNLGTYCLIYTVQHIVQPEKAPPAWARAGLAAASNFGKSFQLQRIIFTLFSFLLASSSRLKVKEAEKTERGHTQFLYNVPPLPSCFCNWTLRMPIFQKKNVHFWKTLCKGCCQGDSTVQIIE